VPSNAEFSIEVLKDPTGCEVNNVWGLTSPTPTVSVYRRPLISTNLKFVTKPLFGPPIDNIMWDGREPSLESQAIDATLGHAQALTAPTEAQVKQMVDFEKAIFSAQIYDNRAGSLTAAGARGGPANLQLITEGQFGFPPFTEYDPWAVLPDGAERARQRQSIARGQAVFNTKTFNITDVAGFNDFPGIGNPAPNSTCGTCHNVLGAGADGLPDNERDLGTTGTSSAAIPQSGMPLFKITCPAGTRPFGPSVVTTRDPGKALLTGKCADIGKIKVPQLRGLAGHAPYFHDGSAANLQDVVDFYDRRFNINYSTQEREDLINFLKAL
jgi:cytochrome c peroxidase